MYRQQLLYIGGIGTCPLVSSTIWSGFAVLHTIVVLALHLPILLSSALWKLYTSSSSIIRENMVSFGGVIFGRPSRVGVAPNFGSSVLLHVLDSPNAIHCIYRLNNTS